MQIKFNIESNKNSNTQVLLPMGGKALDGDKYTVNTSYMLKNGKPFLPIMGEFHFSRWNRDEWRQSLLKMQAGGIEIAATYVFWIHHEEKQGEWDFTGSRNLREFLTVCSDVGMKVWLRIGPWAHGECRNGGFPDWLVKDETLELRVDNKNYLNYVSKFYQKIAEQTAGMMCKDGGPIIGIQIENEYGHCGGPKDLKLGMEHMKTLKKMAIELGMEVPYYTATGWGGAYVVQDEMLPVLSGYVDAPWADHIGEMPASENFLFIKYHNDTMVGSDLKIESIIAEENDKIKEENNSFKDESDKLKSESDDSIQDFTTGYTFNINRNPYLTAELGAGLQVTAHRRTFPYASDIEAQTLCMLGSGANLIGYYMYHGGYNPEGKYSTLQESIDTGYNNDLPVKSYDFQTCIRETGLINESFKKLKKIHYFIKDMEEVLTDAEPVFAEGIIYTPENMDTPRVCIRHNLKNGAGFIFINNHQRKRKMNPIKDLEVVIKVPNQDEQDYKEIVIKNLCAKTDECKIIPYRLPLGDTLLLETNASYLCKSGDAYYFYTDEEPRYVFEGKSANIITLTTREAEMAYNVGDKLILSENLIITDDRKRFELIMDKNDRNMEINKEQIKELANQDSDERIFEIELAYPKTENDVNDYFLEIDFNGDKAEIYSDGKLLTDWFSNGEVWNVALKRYGYPKSLTVKLYPFRNNVYYDLAPKEGCSLNHVQFFKEIIKML